jgi:hypothetical protein
MNKIPLSYDLGKAKRSNITTDLIPAGFFKFDITRTSYLKRTENREASIVVALKVAEPSDPSHQEFIGCEFGSFISMSSKSDWVMANAMDAIFGRHAEGTEVDIDEWVGKQVCAQVSVEVFNGSQHNKVERFVEVTKFHKLTTATAGTQRAASAAGKTTALPSTGGAPSGGQIGDDDSVPF